MHPQLLQLANARKLLQSCLMAPGLFAQALHPARLRGRRGRPPHMHLTRWPARPASSAGTDPQCSRQQAARQPCPPLPCRHTACSAGRAVAAAAPQPASHASRQLLRPPGLRPPSAARSRRLYALRQVAPSLYHWPHRARTAVERRRRRVCCAPGTARQGACWTCLPRARAALAACRHPCAPSIGEGRGCRAADAALALGGHPHGRRPMASSGARRRGGRCPSLLLRTRLRCPRYQQGVVLARGPAGLSASGRGRARLSLRLSARPRVPLLECGIRALEQAQAAILQLDKAETCVAAPWHDAMYSAVTG